MSAELYDYGGRGDFYCPEIVKLTKGEAFEDLPPEVFAQLDCDGHSVWSFYFLPGDYHISHKANGGVPSCVKCGQQLVFVAGVDPR